MAFTEAVKLSVKRKAHFACCLCRSVGVELHHIIPQADGGPDTEDNAAPLCPSCHETYGANPTKRKFIREARDFWFEVCATRYASDASRIDALQEMLQRLPTKADMEQLVARVTAVREASDISVDEASGDEALPAELGDAVLDEVSLRMYLRFMYGSLAHCGADALSRLVLDLQGIGHTSIASVHKLLALTRGVTAQVVQERRDAGDDMDARTDAFPIRLFMAVFDEEYCKRFHPAVHAKFADKRWQRPAAAD